MKHHLRFVSVTLLVFLILSPLLTAPLAQDTLSTYDPNVLSYGIYWFGLNDAQQKFVPGEPNPYFDPTKPTMLFAHGWQPGISAAHPPNFTYIEGGGVNTANAWIDDGWNIGIFYWNQFSDEVAVTDAEAKIWVNDGPRNMRWRKGGGAYEEAPPGMPSAAELFYEAYVAAMTEHEYTGGNIRVAGHSLGNQMAVRLTKMVADRIDAGTVPPNLLPTRVALLDPYWSIGPKSYLGDKQVGQMIREYVAELLPKGVLFEWYRSSNLTVPPLGDANEALRPMTMYSDMTPSFAWTDDMSKHCAARSLYFWSYAFAGPPECGGDDCLTAPAKMLSKMSDARLAALMRSDFTWSQSTGEWTPTPDDDTYTSSVSSDAPYTVTQLTASPSSRGVGGVVTVTATVEDKYHAPVGDGTLVTFATDLGSISARSVTHDGVAIAHITTDSRGAALITATTKGAGGAVQNTATVAFGSWAYLPLAMRDYE